MLFGRSQLLLAGIPTGAALIGLLWLKHRRSNQCHHHTDPGGSLSPEENKNIIEDIQNEEIRRIIEEVVEEVIEEKVSVETVNQIETNLAESSDYIIESDKDNCNVNLKENFIDLVKDNSVESELLETFHETEQNNIEESKLLNNSEDLFEIDVDVKSEEKIEAQEEVSILKESREELPEKIKEENLIEETQSKKEDVEITVVETKEISPKVLKETVEKIGDSQEISAEEDHQQQEEVELIQEKKLDTTSSTEEVANIVEEEKVIEKSVQESITDTADKMKTGPTHLAETLASLELDTMKLREDNGETEQKVCTERDSANHSPSEVMLASPSISNFSDAHSEGSSDSGKGHSDVATSPSRTPAGGSSLAGDSAPSIYEFVLPQVIVGRLIGRRGTFLHEIRTSTQTNIYIKRHPDTDKLKICAIEGNQQDIDKALAKIRQKFPLRRFPQLTLEKVSFVTINALPPLKLEDFHLQLVEGVNNDVILSSLITAAHFFLQQPSHPSYSSLGTLNQVMNQVYSTSEAPALETPIKDAVCAAPTMGGWYRAQIVNLDEETGNSTVRFLDYGGYLTLASNSLRQIRGDLLALPFQAVECYLANVAPANEDGWTEEARLFVHNATVGQVLQAQIYDYAEDGTPLVYLYASYGSQVVLINEELVMRGYGVLTSSLQED